MVDPALGVSLKQCQCWDPAGLVWHGKRPKAGNGKKMEIEMENGPKLDRGKNGKKWPKNGFLREFSIIFAIFGPFFAIFAPVQLGAVFHFDFHFFSISGFWPFSMPYKPGRIPTLTLIFSLNLALKFQIAVRNHGASLEITVLVHLPTGLLIKKNGPVLAQEGCEMVSTLSFLSLIFGKGQGKPHLKARIVYPSRTQQNPWKRRGKTLQKNKEFLAEEKQGIPKKTRKGQGRKEWVKRAGQSER